MNRKRTDKVDAAINKAKSHVEKRRREYQRFDAMTEEEKRIATENGLNPYEPKAVRDKKQAAVKRELDKFFRSLPRDTQEELRSLGIYGNKADRIIRRSTGEIRTK